MQYIRWASGSAKRETIQVGPKHDPYSRTIVTIMLGDRRYQLVECGLSGSFLCLPGGGEVRYVEPLHMFDDDATKRCCDNYDAEVVKHTGFNSTFWMHKLWGTVEKRRWRHDPEAYEAQLACEAMLNRCM